MQVCVCITAPELRSMQVCMTYRGIHTSCSASVLWGVMWCEWCWLICCCLHTEESQEVITRSLVFLGLLFLTPHLLLFRKVHFHVHFHFSSTYIMNLYTAKVKWGLNPREGEKTVGQKFCFLQQLVKTGGCVSDRGWTESCCQRHTHTFQCIRWVKQAASRWVQLRLDDAAWRGYQKAAVSAGRSISIHVEHACGSSISIHLKSGEQFLNDSSTLQYRWCSSDGTNGLQHVMLAVHVSANHRNVC